MRTLVILVGLLASGSAFALTDYNCVNSCTAEGNMYNFCVSKCSYDSPAPSRAGPPKQTDYGCVNRCTAKGNMYSYCVQECSY